MVNLSSTGLGCIGTKNSKRLEIKLSFHRTGPMLFTFLETARICAVFMDPKDDGIGAKEDEKDAPASGENHLFRRLVSCHGESCRTKHGM